MQPYLLLFYYGCWNGGRAEAVCAGGKGVSENAMRRSKATAGMVVKRKPCQAMCLGHAIIIIIYYYLLQLEWW
jgi:hypothetical protein